MNHSPQSSCSSGASSSLIGFKRVTSNSAAQVSQSIISFSSKFFGSSKSVPHIGHSIIFIPFYQKKAPAHLGWQGLFKILYDYIRLQPYWKYPFLAFLAFFGSVISVKIFTVINPIHLKSGVDVKKTINKCQA